MRETIGICTQGGINAVNGFLTNFNVTTVQMVHHISYLNKDGGRHSREGRRQESSSDFSGVLNKVLHKDVPSNQKN